MRYSSALTLLRPDQDDAALSQVFNFVEDGHLAVMVVAQSPPVPASAYDMLSGDLWAQEVEAARSLVRERADAVEEMMAERGVAGHVTAHVAGTDGLSQLVASAARYTDIVLLTGEQARHPDLRHALVTGGLFESGSPLVLAGAGQALPVSPDLVQIAWNARPEAARAVKLALPLIKAAKRVQAILIDPVPTERGHGPEPGATFATYLGYHDVEVEVLPLPSRGQDDAEVLTRQVASAGADYLVMGAYGHSRLRERIFGGTTQAMLERPPCPLFMAH